MKSCHQFLATLAVLCCVITVVGVSNIAFTDGIGLGFDLFNTPAGSTSVDPVGAGPLPKIQLKGDGEPIIGVNGPSVIPATTIASRKAILRSMTACNTETAVCSAPVKGTFNYQ